MKILYFLKFFFIYNFIDKEIDFMESVKPNASYLEGEGLNTKYVPVNSVVYI